MNFFRLSVVVLFIILSGIIIPYQHILLKKSNESLDNCTRTIKRHFSDKKVLLDEIIKRGLK